MKRLLLFFLLLSFHALVNAQEVTADSICKLESALSESSGLMYIDGKIFTHNDSGNEPEIYAVDSVTGKITQTTYVKNAKNKDWEDICADDSFVYIGDFGNNQGTRKDLRIYKISKIELMEGKDSVESESLFFSFGDQVSFTSSQFQTNYDAEAMISIGDSLYIFSKNWGDFKTRIYPIPKQAGTYVSNFTHTSNTQGMVTGATFNPDNNIVLLCGYSFTGEFVFKYSDFSLGFTPKREDRFVLIHKGSSQIEGITYSSNNSYFLSSETFQSLNPILQRIHDVQLLKIEAIAQNSLLYPNPVKQILKIRNSTYKSASIYSLQGKLVLESTFQEVDISRLGLGQYYLYVTQTDGKIVYTKFQKTE